jgi:hypothetical protein
MERSEWLSQIDTYKNVNFTGRLVYSLVLFAILIPWLFGGIIVGVFTGLYAAFRLWTEEVVRTWTINIKLEQEQ